MLDVQNPEINVDEIMRRIQEKVRLRRENAPPQVPGTAPMPLESSLSLNRTLADLRDRAQVGTSVPAMTRTRGLKRAVALPMAKVFLRIAQLITREQRAFNQAVITAVEALVDRQAQESVNTARRLNELAMQLSQTIASNEAHRAELERRLDQMQSEGTTRERAHDHLRMAVSLQERRLEVVLEEARRRLPEPLDQHQLQTLSEELSHVADAGYLAFEDAFRGSRAEIKERVSVYVPKLRAAAAGTDQSPVLDIGCGRGELLEVLREQGLKASGVDSNRGAVDICRELKLDVVDADAFEVLRKTPDATLGGLAALHVVEHLPYPLVLKLVDEALRVLRPGGIVIFETPNPNNILVGATNFYVDPTHRNPVHPQTLRFLLEARGLSQVETIMLHPYPKEMRFSEDTAVARTLNEYLYGPQDYAVVGRRP